MCSASVPCTTDTSRIKYQEERCLIQVGKSYYKTSVGDCEKCQAVLTYVSSISADAESTKALRQSNLDAESTKALRHYNFDAESTKALRHYNFDSKSTKALRRFNFD